MSILPESIQKTIEEFSKLPGIGPKTAQRLTFYLLRRRDQDVAQFGKTVGKLKDGIRYCARCCNLTVSEFCGVCQNPKRDTGIICVVEEMMDLVAIEQTGEYRGLYHVLHGVISPVDNIGPDELKIAELIERVKKEKIKEIIFALNPSMEGEATLAYLMNHLKPLGIKVTRLARGIPVGGDLEYADAQTLRRALEGRMDY
ncbi:MAG: recombination mediator RecR [Candidatus Peregrinibacteria bacterium]